MRVSITGTPGVGKHSIGNRVAEELGLELIDLGSFARKNGLTTPDPERETEEVDVDRLKELLADRDDCIFVSNYAESVPAGIILVVRCRPKELARRLKERNWSEKKMRENLQAECLDYCLISALEGEGKAGEIDNSGSLEESVKKAISLIKGDAEPEHGTVDYSEFADKLDELI